MFQSNIWDETASDNSDNDQVSEVCELLYSSSAKCNKNYYSAQEASYNVSAFTLHYDQITQSPNLFYYLFIVPATI